MISELLKVGHDKSNLIVESDLFALDKDLLSQFKAILNNLDDAALIVDIAEKYVLSNSHAETLFHYNSCSELLGQVTSLLKSNPDTIDNSDQQCQFCTIDNSPHFNSEFKEIFIQHPDISDGLWLSVSAKYLRDQQGKICAGLITYRDVSKYKYIENQLQYESLHDQLTQLPNRKFLQKKLQSAIGRSQQRSGYQFALLTLDLDRFKIINDSLGHVVGDKLLIQFSERLCRTLRNKDLVVRIGDDDFAIFIDNISGISQVCEIVKRLRRILREPFVIDTHEITVDVSIGMTTSTISPHLPDIIFRDAVTAMNYAKRSGNVKYAIFNSDMHNNMLCQMTLEQDLRRAIDRKELFLVYQPIIFLPTQEINGFEALIRWHHPEKGLISPSEFIPIAEQTGLIIPIGDWVLEEACRQMKEWQQEYDFAQKWTISVNLSVKQVQNSNILEQVRFVLEKSSLKPESLKLEMTESILMENSELVIAALKSIQRLGVQLSLDDFGTGYSSLSYLMHFPFDFLKLDCSFIKNLGTNQESMSIIRSILKLAHSLGIEVVAEGLETSSQYAQLTALKCQYGQGYFFSKPLKPSAISNFILSYRSNMDMNHQTLITGIPETMGGNSCCQDELLFQIECLNLEVKRLKQEKMDLEILLDTTAEHAELVELEFQREITDYQEAEKTLQQANRELENLSYVDALTQVANRRQFEEYLEQKWEEAQHENNPLSLIMADVDYFKRYNDEYGHQAGDYCLIRVAQAISKAVVDSDDLVARYGGEEFAIILSNASAERVVKVAESIRTEIQKLGIPHRQSFVSHNITLSLGIASLLPSRLDSLKSLIALADKALYQAKDQGRDRFSMLCH